MFKKLFSLFAALTLSVGLWADGSVFTYTATEKLTLNFMKLGTIATHEFKDGNGKVTYNETITTIGEYAFNGCSKLTSITIPASVTTIGKGAFYKAGLTSITLPAGVTEIGKDAFNQCKSLASVTLPEGVTTIGEYAFNGCSALQSITIPAGVTTIEGYAFYGAGLTSITIPAGVTTIGGYAFYDCTALASVTFLGNACQKGIGNNAFGRVGDPDPALLTLHGTWAKENQPDEDGKWYGGKFELLNDPTALPTLFGDGVKGNKFMHNGQMIIRKDGKNYNVLGGRVK